MRISQRVSSNVQTDQTGARVVLWIKVSGLPRRILNSNNYTLSHKAHWMTLGQAQSLSLPQSCFKDKRGNTMYVTLSTLEEVRGNNVDNNLYS